MFSIYKLKHKEAEKAAALLLQTQVPTEYKAKILPQENVSSALSNKEIPSQNPSQEKN